MSSLPLPNWSAPRFAATIFVAALSWAFLTICVQIVLRILARFYDVSSPVGLVASLFILGGILLISARVLLVDTQVVFGVGHDPRSYEAAPIPLRP